MFRWALAMVFLALTVSAASACDESNSRGASSPNGASGDGGEGPPSAFPGGGW
jgi:hypothetical protein